MKSYKKGKFKNNNVKNVNPNVGKTFYHYTTMQHLTMILQTKMLKPTDVGIMANERPGLWLSTNSIYEKTALKTGVSILNGFERMTFDMQHEYFGHARIKVKSLASIITWAKFKNTSGIPAEVANQLELSGRNCGANPEEWYCSYKQISIKDFLLIEEWTGKEWLPVGEDVFTPNDVDLTKGWGNMPPAAKNGNYGKAIAVCDAMQMTGYVGCNESERKTIEDFKRTLTVAPSSLGFGIVAELLGLIATIVEEEKIDSVQQVFLKEFGYDVYILED